MLRHKTSFSMSLLLLLVCYLITSATSGESGGVKEGLKAGDTLLNVLNTPGKLVSSPIPLSDMTLPFLRALDELRQQALSTTVDDATKRSVLLQLMHYNNRLKIVSSEYAQVREIVDWNTVRLSYGECERSILALRENLMQVLVAPASSQEAQKQYFLKLFQSDYNNVATKLYQGVVNDDGIFNDNLIRVVRKFTRNYRQLTMLFASGLIKLITEAIDLEMAFVRFSNLSDGMDYMQLYWEQKLMKLEDVIGAVDTEIASQWQQQADDDIRDFSQRNIEADYKTYAVKLYEFLKTKFDWRHWMVLAYSPVATYSKHAHIDCPQTFIRFRQGGKNVIVSSVDASNSTFNKYVADKYLNHLPSNTPKFQRDKPLYLLERMMESLSSDEEDTICQNNELSYAGVIVNSAEYHLAADPNHFVHKLHAAKAIIYTNYFNVFLFG